MPFLNGRVTALRFRPSGEAPKMFGDDHLEQLRAKQAGATKFVTADGSTWGWTAGDSVLDTDFTLAKNIVNDALCFEFRVDTDKPPADLLKAYYEVELKALAKGNPSGLPSAKQKREAKESARQRIENETKDGRFRKRRVTPVLWDRTTNEVLFGASSLAQVDRFAGLFEQTFGVELECQTAGEQARRVSDDERADLSDLSASPSNFLPGVSPGDVAWIASEDCRDFLGNEFLLWLWYTTDAVTDTVTCPDGSDVTIMITGGLLLDCPRGQTGRDTFAHEGPTKLPEARRAIQAGKLPRKAGLTLVRHQEQYDLVLHAETLAIQSARLPRPDDTVTEARAKLEARVDGMRGLLEAVDGLFGAFLARRLTAVWAKELEAMQKWLQRGERSAA